VVFPRGPYALLGVHAIPTSPPADPDNDIGIPLSAAPQTPFRTPQKLFPPHPTVTIHTLPKVNEFREGGSFEGGAFSSSWSSPPWESFSLATKWTQAAALTPFHPSIQPLLDMHLGSLSSSNARLKIESYILVVHITQLQR
jgi:hypothetical protein